MRIPRRTPYMAALLVTSFAVALLAGQPAAGGEAIGVTVALQAQPGADVTAPTGESASPGGTVYYLFSVQNTGNFAASYSLALVCAPHWTATLPANPNKRLAILQPGQVASVPVAVSVWGAAPIGSTGDTTLTATANQSPRPSDSASVTTTVVPKSEAPRIVTAPPAQSGTPGTAITYPFVVRNISVTKMAFRLRASSSRSWATSLPGHPTALTSSLAPGQAETVPVRVVIPTSARVGTSSTTTLSAAGLVAPRPAGDDSVTTLVVAPTSLALQVVMESGAGGNGPAYRGRVTLANTGATAAKVRLTAASASGRAVTISGSRSLDVEVPAGASLAFELYLAATGATVATDYLIVSAEDPGSEGIIAQAAALLVGS